MFKKLLRCVRENKRDTILTPLFMVGEVGLECTLPMITGQLIDAIKDGADMNLILRYGIILILMATGSMCCGILSGWFAASAGAGFAKNLRHDLFAKVQSFSFSNIDKFSTSSLVTRLTTDVTNVQMAFMMIIRTAVRSPLMLVFAITMSIRKGGTTALVFLVTVPILGFGLFYIARKAMPMFKAVFKKYDKLNNSVQENVKGMRVVKSFVREDYEQKKFADASEDVRNDFTRVEKLLAINNPLMLLAMYICMILIPLLTARIIIRSGGTTMDVGALSTLITYSMQILMSLMMLSMIFVMITISGEAARRIVEVLDTEPTLRNPAEPVTEVADGSVDFENVSFKYNPDAAAWHRLGQDDPDPVDLPALRRHDRQRQGRRRGRPGLRHGGSAQQGRRGSAEERPLLGHRGGKPPLGRSERDRRGAGTRLQAGPGPRLHRRPPRWLRPLH